MEKLSLKLYLLAGMMLMKLQSSAQDDDDDIIAVGRDRYSDMDDISDLIINHHYHITFSDIMIVILVIAACYVFGKIWKGCSYLIIVLAVVFYIMSR